MKITKIIACACFLALCAVPVSAQFEQSPDDRGAADTLDMIISVRPDATTNQLQLQADIWVFNDSNNLVGLSSGFSWDNPNAQLDSAKLSPAAAAGFDFLKFFYDGNNIDSTNAHQRFLISVARLSGPGMPMSTVKRKWASYYFTLSEWNVTDSVILDQYTWNAGTRLSFIGDDLDYGYEAYWTGKKRVSDTAYVVPSNLVLSEDTLYFSCIEGGANPSSQTFEINSDADPLDFSLIEDSPWLLKSPSLGTTPTTINVSINNFGLVQGTYMDTIAVDAPQAANSPQYLLVILTVEPPPPEISVSPGSFFFTSVVDSSNPPSQTLQISNTGGSDLNWTVSNSDPWLDLTPVSGTNAGTVTLSIDMTGLAVGDYYDTVVVSDPDATNDPVRVPVWLSVASGLPEIGVEPSENFIVVDLPPDNPDTLDMGPPPLDIPPVTLHIANVGGGLLNFRLTESSSRILTPIPDSGSAPADVEVNFLIRETIEPGYYYDTVWVVSDEATNSPYPVAFTFYANPQPPKIFVNRDTIVMNVYECMDGTTAPLPTFDMFVANIGGDDPLILNFDYDSSFFAVSPPSAVAPVTAILTPRAMHLSAGTYYQSLWIKSERAVNNPVEVVVKYNVLEATMTPSIRTYPPAITVTTQEDSGPLPALGIQIFNRYYGCFEWTLTGGAPWARPDNSSGSVPGNVNFVIDPTGYEFGQYYDTLYVNATGTDNSPKAVPITLKVWRFRGDVTFDNQINLSDITYLISHIYFGGPEPRPEKIVGDVNCDGNIDLADLTYLIAYVYLDGPMPCGNPYRN